MNNSPRFGLHFSQANRAGGDESNGLLYNPITILQTQQWPIKKIGLSYMNTMNDVTAINQQCAIFPLSLTHWCFTTQYEATCKPQELSVNTQTN